MLSVSPTSVCWENTYRFFLAQLLFAIDPRLILQMFDRILPIQRTIHGGPMEAY